MSETTMNQTEQILLQAIQKSLWKTDIPFPEDTDWNAVLKEAEDQAVLGIVIGVAPVETQKEWRGRASVGIAHFVRILHYQEQLYKLFKENDIPMVILKGTAAAIYYPNPSQRAMGDIDFLVPQDYFEHAKEVLKQNGYEIKDDPRYLRHIDVCKEQFSFEMHRYFNDVGFDVDQFILPEIPNAEITSVFGCHFPILPRLSNGLVLLGHMAGHVQTGLGLRQVVDWVLYVDRELDDKYWDSEFQKAAREAGLETLAVTITKMSQEYLGLTDSITWCKDANSAISDMLMDSILLSGNFGKKQGRGRSVANVVTRFKKKGFLRYLQIAGEYNWKTYHKHKWLKPLCWIYQIGRYVRQGLQANRGEQLKEDVEHGKQRSDLLKQLKIG